MQVLKLGRKNKSCKRFACHVCEVLQKPCFVSCATSHSVRVTISALPVQVQCKPERCVRGGARVGVRSFKRVEPFCRVFFFFGGGGEFSESGGEFQLYAIPIDCAAFAPIQKVLWHHPACTSNISCLSHPQSSEHRISRGAKTFREACWSSAANQRRSKQTARLVNIAWKLSVVHTSGY